MDDIADYLAIRQKHMDTILRGGSSTKARQSRAARTLNIATAKFLETGRIHQGDSAQLLKMIRPESIALSVWSPPYFVGKSYEAHLDFPSWQRLIRTAIKEHYPLLKPGGFLAINIADILCFQDPSMPRLQAQVLNGRRSPVTREDVLAMQEQHPQANRHQLAALLGCSEQTVDRRLNGNNIRGGKYENQTRVKLVGGLIEEWALESGLYPYDRRVWVKDPAWENSRWASSSYRAIDEFEYIYFLWKPGVTTVDRSKLSAREWSDWGARAVWTFPSVRANDDHEAKFPLELPRRVIRLLSAPGDIILDCFMGSGTTAIAALQEGRDFVGIELSEHYSRLASEAVRKMIRFPNVTRPTELDDRSGKTGTDREGLFEASGASAARLSRGSG